MSREKQTLETVLGRGGAGKPVACLVPRGFGEASTTLGILMGALPLILGKEGDLKPEHLAALDAMNKIRIKNGCLLYTSDAADES